MNYYPYLYGSMEGVRINESVWNADNGNIGKIAVFTYAGNLDPSSVLELAVIKYVGDSKDYHELVDANMNCPWVRVVISGIDDMSQSKWNGQTLKQFIRDSSIDNILQ